MSDVKNILDSIIKSTHGKHNFKHVPDEMNDSDKKEIDHNAIYIDNNEWNPTDYKEKLSFFVLKDIIHAMMHDDTKDCDEMIDNSIMDHIKNDYKGTCYGYLKCAKEKLNSPLLGSVIQELDKATDDATDSVEQTKEKKDPSEKTVKEVLNNVNNYADFRDQITEEVSKQVVDDVSGALQKQNEAPTFDKIDEKLKKPNDGTNNEENKEDTTKESVILRIEGSIMTEQYMMGNQITTEEGIERAITQYCIAQMDFMFKMDPSISVYNKYNI